jgi:hypothetical protein
MFANYVENLVE